MVKTGISTASLFGRMYTEDAVELLNAKGVKTAEVFLESFCEYNREYGELIAARKGDLDVHSVHTLTTQFESTLYSVNEKAQKDSFDLLEKTMQAANAMRAKYYTFHGLARVKRTPYYIDFDRCGEITRKIIDVCERYDVSLAYENVHWAYYNYIGFFSELKKREKRIKGTLDIKQARQSGIKYEEFIKEMGEDIVTVHISDIDKDGKMCLPGRGTTDFKRLFKMLSDYGFSGAILLEVYKGDYDNMEELIASLDHITELSKDCFV